MNNPILFPFELRELNPQELEGNELLELLQQGLNEDINALN